MRCPYCKTIVEDHAGTCWLCKSPMSAGHDADSVAVGVIGVPAQ